MEHLHKLATLIAVLWSDSLTAALLVTLLALALITVVMMYRRFAMIRASIRSIDVDGDGRDHGTGRYREGLDAAILKERVATVGETSSPVWVLRREPYAIARQYVTSALAHAESFRMGARFTGFALIVTFFLIALVLVTYVSDAVRPSADPGDLPEAVRLLGAKFAVSAIGVALAIAHHLIAGWFHRSLNETAFAAVDRAGERLRSLEMHRLELAAHGDQTLIAMMNELTLTRRAIESQTESIDAHLGQARESFASTAARIEMRLENLGSIEVSIKDMGEKVAANLGNVMRDTVGQQICTKIEEVAAHVDHIATRVEDSLRDAVGTVVTGEIQAVRVALDAIRVAVEQQGGSQLEKLLEQLRATVSGGFHNESQAMAAALQQFAAVVPQLEQQMRALVDSMANDMTDRTTTEAAIVDEMLSRVADVIPRMEERLQLLTGNVTDQLNAQNSASAAATSEVMASVSALVNKLDAQQSGMSDAVAQLSAASAEGAQRMVAAIAAEADTRVSKVAESATAEFQNTLVALREAATLATSAHADVQNAGTQAQKVVSEVLGETKRAVQEMMTAGRASAEHGERALALSREVRGVVESLRTVVETLGKHTNEVSTTILQQGEIQRQQQATLEKIESVLPKLIERYQTSFKDGAEQLAMSWQGHASGVERLIKTVSNQFIEGVEELGQNVEKLEKSLAQPRAR
jgi:hypothetical protein